MNPFDQKPTKSLEDMMLDWKDLSPRPYKKLETDPYTKARIILMNGIEVEAVMFGHNFNRNCEDNDLRRDLALMRRIEAGQQKHVNWLSPSDETPLETTIGYEQLAVDLTAWARHARARRVREILHGLRPARGLRPPVPLREPAQGRRGPAAHELVLDTIEITPAVPPSRTIAIRSTRSAPRATPRPPTSARSSARSS